MTKKIFQLDLDEILKSKAPGLYKKLPRFVVNYIKRLIHIDELNDILAANADKEGVDFMDACVDYFGLTLHIEGLEKLSKDERYIFASNHPLGGLDGICLSSVLGNHFDKKIKYVVNDFLYYIENLQPIFLPVNKHGGQAKVAMEQTSLAFDSDNQIITFPAGLCSRRKKGKIRDMEWKKSFIHKSIESERYVVPVFFEGRNSNFFYKFANIRELLGVKFNVEMILLPNEMFKNKGQTFSIYIGEPIPYTTFDKTKNLSQWADYVKDIVYDLKES